MNETSTKKERREPTYEDYSNIYESHNKRKMAVG
jgi:hypothetical protein